MFWRERTGCTFAVNKKGFFLTVYLMGFKFSYIVGVVVNNPITDTVYIGSQYFGKG